MSDTKISQLPHATAVSATDILPLVQNLPPLTTKGALISDLQIYFRTAFDPVYVNLANQARTIPGGRLTLESGTPVTTRDQIGFGLLYYTPYRNNNIFTWNGSSWQRQIFSEIFLNLSGLTTGKNYDVFIDSAAATLILSNPWTDNITRADALGTQDGTTVLGSDHTRLWLGTIRASSAVTTEDSGGGSSGQVGGQRFVWNAYNQVPRFISVIDTTASWNYTSDITREANGAVGNRVEYVTGADETQIQALVQVNASVNSNVNHYAKVGVGLDSTTSFSGLVSGHFNAGASAVSSIIFGQYIGYPGQGYHFVSWNERGADVACTFFGQSDNLQSGLSVNLLM